MLKRRASRLNRVMTLLFIRNPLVCQINRVLGMRKQSLPWVPLPSRAIRELQLRRARTTPRQQGALLNPRKYPDLPGSAEWAAFRVPARYMATQRDTANRCRLRIVCRLLRPQKTTLSLGQRSRALRLTNLGRSRRMGRQRVSRRSRRRKVYVALGGQRRLRSGYGRGRGRSLVVVI